MVAPASARIFDNLPLFGEGTSASTLSVVHLDQAFALLDRVADLLQPLGHGALGDRLTHLRERDLDGRRWHGENSTHESSNSPANI